MSSKKYRLNRGRLRRLREALLTLGGDLNKNKMNDHGMFQEQVLRSPKPKDCVSTEKSG